MPDYLRLDPLPQRDAPLQDDGPASRPEAAGAANGETEPDGPPVLLICGDSPEAMALAELAAFCGFDTEVAATVPLEDGARKFPRARKISVTPGYEELVETCGIGREHFVCIFGPRGEGDYDALWNAINQALQSHARYIGVGAPRELRDGMFRELREHGVPDAELAAVCWPLGLPVEPQTPRELAIATLAEILSVRAGTLGRLRLED